MYRIIITTFLMSLISLPFSYGTSIIEAIEKKEHILHNSNGIPVNANCHLGRIRTPEQDLLFTTVRIEKVNPDDGKIFSTGTGFMARIGKKKEEQETFLVTNKHVVFSDKEEEKNSSLYLYFHFVSQSKRDEMCKICLPESFVKKFHKDWQYDICAIWLGTLIDQIPKKTEGQLFFVPLNFDGEIYSSSSPSTSFYTPPAPKKYPTLVQQKGFTASTQVTMVGYPEGRWDDINNYPIMRQGNTATDPEVDFKGKKEYLVDIALYPGSSGSPLFMLKKTQEVVLSDFPRNPQDFKLREATSIYLVGMVYAGPNANFAELLNRRFESIKKTLKRQGDDIENNNKRQKTAESQIGELQEDIRDIFTEIGADREEGSSSEANDTLTLHKLTHYSNLAYIIKPEIIRSCIVGANSNKKSVEFSGIEFFISEDLTTLRTKSVKQLKQEATVKDYKI